MDTISIGTKDFSLNPLSLGTLEILQERLSSVCIDSHNTDGMIDIGDAIMFLLMTICDGDEKKALEIGQKLAETEINNVTIDQIIEDIEIVKRFLEREV